MENNKILGLDGKMYDKPQETISVFDDNTNTNKKPQIGMIMDGVENPLENKENTQTLSDIEEKTKLDNKTLQRLMAYQNRKPSIREYPKISRNDPCPCGSGKKYKNCCLNSGKYEKYIKK